MKCDLQLHAVSAPSVSAKEKERVNWFWLDGCVKQKIDIWGEVRNLYAWRSKEQYELENQDLKKG